MSAEDEHRIGRIRFDRRPDLDGRDDVTCLTQYTRADSDVVAMALWLTNDDMVALQSLVAQDLAAEVDRLRAERDRDAEVLTDAIFNETQVQRNEANQLRAQVEACKRALGFQMRGVHFPCEKCSAMIGSNRDDRGFMRCANCGYPSP